MSDDVSVDDKSDGDRRPIDSLDELAEMVESTPYLLFNLTVLRTEQTQPEDTGDDNSEDDSGDPLDCAVQTSASPNYSQVRAKVVSRTSDGEVRLDFGVQFHWEEPVEISSELARDFAEAYAIPHTVARAAFLLDEVRRTHDILVEEVPFQWTLPYSFSNLRREGEGQTERP